MPTTPDPRLRRLCAAWLDAEVTAIDPVDTGGFSGSQVCRVQARDGGVWAIKSWGAVEPRRIAWVHALTRHLRAGGIEAIPLLATTRDGGTSVVDEFGVAWELTEWIEGLAVESPDAARAASAAACLAHVHRVAATWPACPVRDEPAAAVRRRVEHADRLLEHPWPQLRRALSSPARPMVAQVLPLLEQAIDLFVVGGGERGLRRVAAARPPVVAVQAVLRDIWWEHVLFDRHCDRVAGIIDLHAASIDTPATDLARLLGSWEPVADGGHGRSGPWAAALAAYESIKPLSAGERGLVRWLDATGVVFGLDNWFRWVLEENREFGEAARVVRRIEQLLGRLSAALVELADGDGLAV